MLIDSEVCREKDTWVHPTLGHLALSAPGLALLTSASQGDPLSLVPLDSPDVKSHVGELHSASIPNTFEAAWDLIP